MAPSAHLVVVNPHAGKGRGIQVAWRVEALYREAGIPFEIRHTRGRGDAEAIAREAAPRVAAVIAVGGDGTFHEVANGIASAAVAGGGPGAVAAAGCLPIGTGNDFVKSLDLVPELEPCFAAVRGGKRRRIDLGCFRMGEHPHAHPHPPEPRWFANQIQIGYGAAVVHDFAAPGFALKRYLPGHLAYAAGGIFRLPTETRELTLTYDGDGPEPATRRGRFFEVHIANGRYCGGGISYVPTALLDDGLLDVVTLAPRSLAWRARTMTMIRERKLVEGPGIERRRVRRIDVRDVGTFPISADGEPYDAEDGVLRVEVVPGALDVLAP